MRAESENDGTRVDGGDQREPTVADQIGQSQPRGAVADGDDGGGHGIQLVVNRQDFGTTKTLAATTWVYGVDEPGDVVTTDTPQNIRDDPSHGHPRQR